MRQNVEAFERYRLVPRVMVNVEQTDLRMQLLGQTIHAPILVAPMGGQHLATPQGDRASAHVASELGLGFVASLGSASPHAELVDQGAAACWLQVFMLRDRKRLIDVIRHGEASGYHALCLTVDSPVMGLRQRDLAHGASLPESLAFWPNVEFGSQVGKPNRGSAANVHFNELVDPSASWEAIAWLREQTSLPIVLKGIVAAEDARTAVDSGADAIWVSNHGGRQLDGAIPTIEALPMVVGAVEDRVPVVLDGGIRSGFHLLVAFALGASAIAIGRPVYWALAAGGPAAVRNLLTAAVDELRTGLKLMGVSTPRNLRGLCSRAGSENEYGSYLPATPRTSATNQ